MPYQALTTGIVRITRMRAYSASSINETLKYKVHLLLPKSDTFTMQRINNAIANAMIGGLTEKWCNLNLEKLMLPIMDGDGVRRNGLPYDLEYSGHHVIAASSIHAPEFVDTNLVPILDEKEIYDGMFGYASVKFHPFVYEETPIVLCSLGPIMKIADGIRITHEDNRVFHAFAHLPVVNTDKNLIDSQGFFPLKHSHTINSTEAHSYHPDFDVNNDKLPWLEEDFLAKMDEIKEQKMSLAEFKSLMER